MIISIIITSNVYLLYCQTQTLIDTLLNSAALNYLLHIDNDAVKLIQDSSDVVNLIKDKASEHIDRLRVEANRKRIFLPTLMRAYAEDVFFIILYLYTLAVPLIFIFYNANDWEFDPPQAITPFDDNSTNTTL
jgi:hypothetical protein